MQHRLKKGEPGYKPMLHADLAEITGADANQIKNMLGGVRHGTKIKRVRKSKYVDPICDALGIERLVRVETEVPARMAKLIKKLQSVPADRLAEIESDVEKALAA